jgi:hypothetical protein
MKRYETLIVRKFDNGYYYYDCTHKIEDSFGNKLLLMDVIFLLNEQGYYITARLDDAFIFTKEIESN